MECNPFSFIQSCPSRYPAFAKELYMIPLLDIIVLVSAVALFIFKSVYAFPLAIIFASSLLTRLVVKLILPSLGVDMNKFRQFLLKHVTIKDPLYNVLLITVIVIPLLFQAPVYVSAIVIGVSVGIYRGLISLNHADKYQQILNRVKNEHLKEKLF